MFTALSPRSFVSDSIIPATCLPFNVRLGLLHDHLLWAVNTIALSVLRFDGKNVIAVLIAFNDAGVSRFLEKWGFFRFLLCKKANCQRRIT